MNLARTRWRCAGPASHLCRKSLDEKEKGAHEGQPVDVSLPDALGRLEWEEISPSAGSECAMDFPIADLMDEDACYAKLVTWLHPDGLASPRCGARDDLGA